MAQSDKTFIGYCQKCDTLGEIHIKDIMHPYKREDKDARCKCPNCGYYQNVDDLIPF